MNKETIVAAALIYKGVVYQLPRPNRHHNIIHKLYNDSGRVKGIATESQGFVTSTGRYVDRVEGLAIAVEAEQIIKKHGFPGELFSEDMW